MCDCEDKGEVDKWSTVEGERTEVRAARHLQTLVSFNDTGFAFNNICKIGKRWEKGNYSTSIYFRTSLWFLGICKSFSSLERRGLIR